MNNKNSWGNFIKTGKVADYLSYREYQDNDSFSIRRLQEVYEHKNGEGYCPEGNAKR